MTRVYNFSAGPATLPVEVLEKAQKDLVDFKGKGVSVMEMSHRSSEFKDIFYKAMNDLKILMSVPDNYKILFLQGGASSQFGMVPLNLYSDKARADYINTGAWSKKAIAEAKRYGTVRVVASSEDNNFTYIPDIDASIFDPEADFVHITTNNTIYGTVFPQIPDTGAVPLVADMSSNILGQVYDVGKFGVIYAGAQKNIGPAGLTVVIVREDLMGKEMDITPKMFSYKAHAEAESMLNTPPCFAVYMAGLVFEWLLDLGGVAEMEKQNREKAAMLYDHIDNSSVFHSTVVPGSRSIMNVPFVTNDEVLDKKFIEGAAARGLTTLKGHRTVGGMRASIYNAMPREGVMALVDYMKEFEMAEKR
jgi:phosphoserine aminotransferase